METIKSQLKKSRQSDEEFWTWVDTILVENETKMRRIRDNRRNPR